MWFPTKMLISTKPPHFPLAVLYFQTQCNIETPHRDSNQAANITDFVSSTCLQQSLQNEFRKLFLKIVFTSQSLHHWQQRTTESPTWKKKALQNITVISLSFFFFKYIYKMVSTSVRSCTQNTGHHKRWKQSKET